jgi:biopolymer transport protein ExbB/TolQ
MMDIGALLKAFIYLISSSLLYPILFLLVILTFLIIVYAGSFFAEWLERLRLEKCAPQDFPAVLSNGASSNIMSHRVNQYIRVLHQIIRDGDDSEAAVENLLQDTFTIKNLSEEECRENEKIKEMLTELKATFSTITELLRNQLTKSSDLNTHISRIKEITHENLKNVKILQKTTASGE